MRELACFPTLASFAKLKLIHFTIKREYNRHPGTESLAIDRYRRRPEPKAALLASHRFEPHEHQSP
jgi:hypothetical protein